MDIAWPWGTESGMSASPPVQKSADLLCPYSPGAETPQQDFCAPPYPHVPAGEGAGGAGLAVLDNPHGRSFHPRPKATVAWLQAQRVSLNESEA